MPPEKHTEKQETGRRKRASGGPHRTRRTLKRRSASRTEDQFEQMDGAESTYFRKA